MKKLLLTALVAAAMMPAAAQELTVLDLTKATTPLEFDEDNGAWTGTYDEDAEAIESQCFNFVHSSMGSMAWWGFTASNSTDNSFRSNTVKYQFSNMACGGIVLDADGTVKKDEHGAVVTDAAVPYLVAYYGAYFGPRPVDMTFAEGKAYEPVGVYVNLNNYAYYSIEQGDGFARAFTNGDRFTLTVHGVNPDGSEKSVDVILAKFDDGDLTINRGWRYVDLSTLGVVNELYFTMASTDSGAYGDNTPGYFCLDKLMVKEAAGASVAAPGVQGASISYDRAAASVNVAGADFAAVYDALGRMVCSSHESTFTIGHLPAGVYMVRAGNASVKIAR
ncbi:MAG: DUF4465 domain-containing protein [Muribaculaceae bacterium]|nr:DUF4465 domain-containing protein [Muribaculaceae bacterium]